MACLVRTLFRMRSFFAVRYRAWVLTALFLVLPCCANTCARGPDSYARVQVRGWRFEAPPARTWQTLREILQRQGVVMDAPAPPFDADARAQSRGDTWSVRFVGMPRSYSVLVRRITRTSDGDGGTQPHEDNVDDSVMWELVQRVEPERAAEVHRESAAEAARSRAYWSACDEFWTAQLRQAARSSSKRESPSDH